MTSFEKAKEIVRQNGDCQGLCCDCFRDNVCPCFTVCGELLLDMCVDDLEKLCLDKAKQFIADTKV